MRALGVDLGSRQVKIVLMEGKKIIIKFEVGTMSFYRDYCSFNGKLEIDVGKLEVGQFDMAVSTGYGRNNTDIKRFTPINEVKAHVYGAMWQTGLKDFILLDVGGQDVKLARVQNSMLADIELNDKCAASCGRYLENMAAILEVPLEKMTSYFEGHVELNSTCAVFSESELIGKIAEGIGTEKLCAGVNYSLYKRLQPMLAKFKGDKLVLTGGVAKSGAIRKFLKKNYNEVISVEDPQFNGAIGCCLCAGMKSVEMAVN